MTFLNWSMLFGLLALAIPILIHLLNRSKPRVMEWAAMQFLLSSLTYRSRRILLEELVLLVLRCLTLACLALALARPFLPSRSSVPWVLVLPAFLAAAVGIGLAAALWNQTVLRRRLLQGVAALAVAGLGVAALERWRQGQWWMGGHGGKDVAVLLDASMSMNVTVDGETNFRRAIGEARAMLDACRPGDAFSVILAGPVPHALVRKPTSDRRELSRVLQGPDCHPLGGSLSVLEALNAAGLALADGANPTKTIILFTDGQNAGWDLQSDVRWRFVADSFRRFAAPPKVIIRRLPVPSAFRNAAVTGLTLSRQVIGPDRPVTVDVQVLNAGSAPAQPTAVSLFDDDTLVERQPFVKELLPNVTEILHFTHTFVHPGRHVLKAVVEAEDDLRDDNSLEQVVDVLARLPVLIVDGAPGEKPLQRASAFLRLALAPAAADPRRDAAPDESQRFLVEAAVTNVADLADLADLNAFRVVILANVSRLPAAATDRLAAFVKKGGGLLIAPGQRAEPEFYNTWQSTAGERLVPALLQARVSPPEPIHVEPRSFTHPALRLVSEPRQSDAAQGLVASYWKLVVDGRDPEVRIGARLEQGDPLLVERQFGQGYVMLTSLALDRRDSNLPSLASFVPLVHELVYYLATPLNTSANIKPGTEYAFDLATPVGFDRDAPGSAIAVRLPSGVERAATLTAGDLRSALRFNETREPGLYRITLPAALAQPLAGGTNPVTQLAFTVVRQSQESTLTPLSDADLATVRTHVDSFVAGTREEMLTAFAGDVPGQELWRVLALCAILTLLAETALARWIAIKRRFHGTEAITLKTPAQSVDALRERMQTLVDSKG